MTVAFHSASGFAFQCRTKRQVWDQAHTERRREERAAARAECNKEWAEQNAFKRLAAPAHARGLEQHSREWFEACDRAFCEAMEAHPETRPSAGALQTVNGAGSSR